MRLQSGRPSPGDEPLAPESQGPVTFVMSLSPEEFRATASILSRTELASGSDRVEMPAGDDPNSARVLIAYTPLPPVTLGGLLALPRAEVVLTFDAAVPPDARTAFLDRFLRTFQRGGG